jgi:hypothetical protein
MDNLKEISESDPEYKRIVNSTNFWARGEFEKLNDCQELQVEAYYSGFIAFYDEQSRSDMIDRDILFKWHDHKGKSIVDVYITPPPIRVKGKGVNNNFETKYLRMTPPPDTQSLGSSDPPTPKGPPPPPVQP